MLVLTRKQSETIQIGDSITITVLRMKGKAVRLGIQAPHDLNVIRGELAFDQPVVEESASTDEESGETVTTVKPKSRTRDFRKDSWPAKATQPTESATSCSAVAWTI